MRKRIGTETIHFGGQVHTVDVWIDIGGVAMKLLPKALKNKPSTIGLRESFVAGGHVSIIVRPQS